MSFKSTFHSFFPTHFHRNKSAKCTFSFQILWIEMLIFHRIKLDTEAEFCFCLVHVGQFKVSGNVLRRGEELERRARASKQWKSSEVSSPKASTNNWEKVSPFAIVEDYGFTGKKVEGDRKKEGKVISHEKVWEGVQNAAEKGWNFVVRQTECDFSYQTNLSNGLEILKNKLKFSTFNNLVLYWNFRNYFWNEKKHSNCMNF